MSPSKEPNKDWRTTLEESIQSCIYCDQRYIRSSTHNYDYCTACSNWLALGVKPGKEAGL